jgi:hypothetical protein
MEARIDVDGVANEVVDEACADRVEEPTEERRDHGPLPWIGTLPNPRLGPMLVLNDGGYLVPLFTAGDLVRGCRYLWRRGRS